MTKKKSLQIPESVKARFQLSSSSRKILTDLFVLFQLLGGIIFSLSLWTFASNDPDWLTGNFSAEVSNSIGIVGSWISSFLYSIMGVTAWIIPLILFINPINYFIKQNENLDAEIDYKSNFFTFLGFVILCFSVSLLIDLHIDPYDEYFPQSSSGVIGSYLSSLILLQISIIDWNL